MLNMSCFSRMNGLFLFRCFSYHSKSSLALLKVAGYFDYVLPQNSDKHLNELEASRSLKIYCGFDPTAHSLQLGNLVAIIGLLRSQLLGHNVIALIGEGTATIGDPTGKLDARLPIPYDLGAQYVLAFKESLQKIQSNFQEQILPNYHNSKDPGKFEIMNNLEWIQSVHLLTFISEVARYVRFQELAHKDSVKLRQSTGTGMSMKEFLYPLLQAYDFLHLYQNHNCCVQLGGNDQVGNIDTGITLIRRKLAKSVFGLTVPLLIAPDGSKIGKTTSKRQQDVIWLNSKRLRPFYFFQKLLNQADSMMTKQLLQQLTFFSIEKIQEILSEHFKNPEKRLAQRSLAQELTLLVHGGESLQAAELASRILYSNSAIHSRSENPMHNLTDKLSLSEQDYLVACCVHPTAPIDSPLPVLHETEKASGHLSALTRTLNILQQLKTNERNLGETSVNLHRGLVLNGVQVLKPCIVPVDQKPCTCSEDNCFKCSLVNSQDLLSKAWKAVDPGTGISVLQIGKRMSWFVVPFDRIRKN